MTTLAAESARLSQTLSGLGHSVITAGSADDLVTLLRTEARPDAGLLLQPDPSWITALRGAKGPHIYCVGAIEGRSGPAVQALWDQGFDDVMATDASSEELAGRVGALDRIRAWVGTMGDGFATSVEAEEDAPQGVLATIDELLASEFAQMLGTDLHSEPVPSVPSLAYAAEIPLTLSSDGSEVSLGVGVDADGAISIATMLFGEAVADEIMADALREFANTAGGALKRTALDEGHAYSLGLPTNAMFIAPDPSAKGWSLTANGVRMLIWVTKHHQQLRRLTTAMLREGMVISQPVRNGAGVMLVPAGTVLTEQTVSNLLEWVGPSALVEVARAA